jgi:hypothetical protein
VERTNRSIERRELLKDILTVALLLVVLGYCVNRFGVMQRGIDFPEFYSAAKLLALGHGHEIYDVVAQNQFQITYTGRIGTYFNHPPFELLLYLPFCLLPVKEAYLLWSLLNLALLATTAKLLQGKFKLAQSWRILFLGALIFVPVLLTLIQGQDSILLLFVITKALIGTKDGNEVKAGAWLALGLFKFQIVLPVAFIVGFVRRRSLLGFAAVLALLTLISISISGWHVPVEYARFLMHMSALPLAGIHPRAMANLRGLIEQLSFPSTIRLIITVAASLLVIGVVLYDWTYRYSTEKTCIEVVFAETVLAATLVSYHISPHDLSILLLPIALILQLITRMEHISGLLNATLLLTCIILLLPPLHLWLLNRHTYVFVSVPLLIIFLANRRAVSKLLVKPCLS